MREYTVMLEVTTATASLDEISALLGVDAAPSSLERGRTRNSGSKTRGPCSWRVNVWRCESSAEPGADIAAHMESLNQWLPFSTLGSACLPPDATVELNLGVMYDTYTLTIHIPSEWITLLGENHIGLAISTYPTDFSGAD